MDAPVQVAAAPVLTGVPQAPPAPGDRAMVLLLKLAASADQLLVHTEDTAAADQDGLRRRLRAALAEAWQLLGPHRRPTGGRAAADGG